MINERIQNLIKPTSSYTFKFFHFLSFLSVFHGLVFSFVAFSSFSKSSVYGVCTSIFFNLALSEFLIIYLSRKISSSKNFCFLLLGYTLLQILVVITILVYLGIYWNTILTMYGDGKADAGETGVAGVSDLEFLGEVLQQGGMVFYFLAGYFGVYLITKVLMGYLLNIYVKTIEVYTQDTLIERYNNNDQMKKTLDQFKKSSNDVTTELKELSVGKNKQSTSKSKKTISKKSKNKKDLKRKESSSYDSEDSSGSYEGNSSSYYTGSSSSR